ncbi:hypothetical protein Syun_006116 [Stephania yunnanensis]|uniref:Uncharacterized protein n=1 Tax=Stephania yunnanensis TaxID=152371 RepID=A0AAP0PY95_9MAGN
MCCTIFLSYGFIPLGFLGKVFNEAINNIILQIKIDENNVLFSYTRFFPTGFSSTGFNETYSLKEVSFKGSVVN